VGSVEVVAWVAWMAWVAWAANQRWQKTLCARVKVLKKVSIQPAAHTPPTHNDGELAGNDGRWGFFSGALCTYLMRFFSSHPARQI